MAATPSPAAPAGGVGGLEEALHCGRESRGGRILDGGGGEVAAIFKECRVVECWIPVAPLPGADTSSDGIGKVVVVGDAGHLEGILELGPERGVVVGDEDLVDDVRELLRQVHAVLGRVLGDGRVVLPVVVDGFGDARGGDGAPEDVGVASAQKGDKGAGVGAAVRDPGRGVRRQVEVLEAREDDVAGEEGRVGEGLVGGEEAQIGGGEVRGRDALAVVAVLEDDAQAARGLGELVDDALLQERQAADGARLAALEDDDGAAWLVVSGIEPVAQREGGVAVRLVLGLVVEVIDGNGEVVRGIQEGRVDVTLG